MHNCWIFLFLNADIRQDSSLSPVVFSFQIPSLTNLLHSDELNFKFVSSKSTYLVFRLLCFKLCISG